MKSQTIIEGFFESAGQQPEKAAIILNEETITYATVAENVRRAAAFLQNQGVKSGDRVAFYGEKSPLFAYVYLGCHLSGAVAVPLDVKLPVARIPGLLSQIDPAIVLHPAKLDIAFPHFPFGENILNADPLREYKFPKAGDLADILFTTGTTGVSKGVKLTHKNILAGAVNSNSFIGNDTSDTEIIPLPLHHAFGLRRLRTNLYLGATVVLADGFMFPKLFFDAIENHGATGICMVPAGFGVIRKLMKDRYIPHFRKLKYIEFGSAPMNIELKKELAEQLPEARICMHYGLTEVAANIFTEFHEAGEKLAALGKASPNVQVRILDMDGTPCATGEVGEISVKGDIQTPGYWQNPSLTQSAFTDGWFKTGDLGYTDDEGYFFFSGRKDDMINVGGKKVRPMEIEQALNQHPNVKDSACISVKGGDSLTGEKIKAFVVLQNDEALRKKELTSFLRDKLEAYKIPADYEFIQKIPYTASGKKQREKLK